MTATLSPERIGLPPPVPRPPLKALDLELLDGDRAVGWISGDRVGFRGFADEVEAAHAAWVAHRTLARRRALAQGTRPPPIDSEPLALQPRDDGAVVLASGRPIATLVRPGTPRRTGDDDFGFELRVPLPADELRARSGAYLVYRALRKSGLRWALWRRDAARAPRGATVPASPERARDRAAERITERTTSGDAHRLAARAGRRVR
jgi:hypothetical protein